MQRRIAAVAACVGVAYIAALVGRYSRPIEMLRVADDKDVCKHANRREVWQSNLLEVIMSTFKYRQPASNSVLDFYKLSLQWPPATCSAMTCRRPYLGEFTIHGLWPQLFPDARVPPYLEDPSCTTVTPVQPSAVISQLQPGTKLKLTNQWPNLKDYQNSSVNEKFWRYEWCEHGMCSAWPAQPDSYFNAALQLKSTLEPSGVSLRSFLAADVPKPSTGAGFTPSSTVTYKAGDIQIQLIKKYGKIPEISCNIVNTVLQLWEIRFCYKKKPNLEPDVLMNCPTPFSNGCSTSGGQSRIIFPPA